MGVLCETKTAFFEEVLRLVLTYNGLVDNKYLAEIEKFDLHTAFWRQADAAFGYSDPKLMLDKSSK